MPIYEFACPICGFTTEMFTTMGVEFAGCPNCQGEARKQFSFGQSAPYQEESPWIRTVTEVVSKDGEHAVDREFLKNPTRKNYQAWMKYHKLIPVENEHGGPPTRKVPDRSGERKRIADFCFQRHQERQRIEVRG